MRADFYLSSHGYVSSRTRATSLISEGLVFIDGVKVADPAALTAIEGVDAQELTAALERIAEN